MGYIPATNFTLLGGSSDPDPVEEPLENPYVAPVEEDPPNTTPPSDHEPTVSVDDEPIPEVSIPDVGLGDAQTALRGRVAGEIEKIGARGDWTNATQPGYTAPDPSKTDTIEGAGVYERPEDKVAFQMDQLLNADSAYMQNAVRRAEEQSQKFGALGSSMSVGASQRAAIESALPIAQQDAQTSSKFGMQTQAAENQIGTIEAETELGSSLMMQRMALETQQMSLDQAFKMAAQGLDAESSLMVADIQGRWQMVTNDASMRLDAALKEQLNNQTIDAEAVASVRGAASDLTQNYQISVEELLKDPDFLQLGGVVIKNTLNNMLATTTASIQFLADSSGIQLDGFLDDFEIYLGDFEENARFTANI
jgi:hypothetical protein